jgi:predicted RNA-binding protein YlqC (UPF0109 family)
MADTIDKQFVEFIAKTLVEDPDAVEVDREIDERGVLLQLHVAPDDLGRVIGRGGSTAKSIRTLLRALSVKNDARYNLKIVDSGEDSDADTGVDYEAVDMEDDGASASDESEAPEEVDDEEAVEEPAYDEESDAESDVATRHRSDIDDLKDDLSDDE